MKLAIQEYLDTHTVEQLTKEFGIKVKQHSNYPELYHFCYDQLESPKTHQITKECRGLILNSKYNWEVICHPFNRFANYGESWADEIDWQSVRVAEKIDGSAIFISYHDEKWNVSTKGTPDAWGRVGECNFSFSELFLNTIKQYHLFYWDLLNQFYTYMFELTSPYNRVVVKYEKPELTLIGVRDNLSNEEIPVSEFADLGIPLVKEYPLHSIKQIQEAALELNPMQNEGFVIVDKNFNRLKVKSPSYVMIHHMKDGFGQRRVIRLIQLGETIEVLSYFPEYEEMFSNIFDKIDNMIKTIEVEYKAIKHLTNRKEFALEAVKSKYSSVLFQLLDMKSNGYPAEILEYILHSRRVTKKSGPQGLDEFTFTAEKIETMLGLKPDKINVVLGDE